MLQTRHREDFLKLVSYSRFVELTPSVLAPLCVYLQTQFGESTGIAFIDSTSLAVCKNKRIDRNRVFAGIARRGKTTMGWFYGFKLHLIINDRGELLAKVVHIAKHFGPIHRYPLHLDLLAGTKGGEDTFFVQFTSTAVS